MAKTIAFWILTILFCFAMLGGGIGDITGALDQQMSDLGYPLYFARILGIWKVAGVVALLVPGFGHAKEWAYAGFTISLTGAAASHLAVGDPVTTAIPPLVILGMGIASYFLRPRKSTVVQATAG